MARTQAEEEGQVIWEVLRCVYCTRLVENARLTDTRASLLARAFCIVAATWLALRLLYPLVG
jgi:hypothetical protein